MKATKNGTVFAIYATPVANLVQENSELRDQYKEYQDVFEKNNADMLPQHHPYDCDIDLQ